VIGYKGSRVIPLILGIAMLGVVLAAGLFPNAGTVQAQSSCAYPPCPSTSSVPVWEYVSILVIVALAAIVALLFIMRRRRPPRAAPGAPPAAAGGAAAVPPSAGGPSPPAMAPPPYLETPEDVGHPPPTVPTTPPAGAAAPPAGATGGAEPSSDIDSLMAELDKISTEILKKQPKKPPGGTSGDEPEPGGTDQ